MKYELNRSLDAVEVLKEVKKLIESDDELYCCPAVSNIIIKNSCVNSKGIHHNIENYLIEETFFNDFEKELNSIKLTYVNYIYKYREIDYPIDSGHSWFMSKSTRLAALDKAIADAEKGL